MFRCGTPTNFKDAGRNDGEQTLVASVGRVRRLMTSPTATMDWSCVTTSHELEQDRLDIAPARTRRDAPANISRSPKTAPSRRLASTSAMARRDDTAARRDLQTTADQEHLPRRFAA